MSFDPSNVLRRLPSVPALYPVCAGFWAGMFLAPAFDFSSVVLGGMAVAGLSIWAVQRALAPRALEPLVWTRVWAPLGWLPLGALGPVIGLHGLAMIVLVVAAVAVFARLSDALPRPLDPKARRRLLLVAATMLVAPGVLLFQLTVIHDAFQYLATTASLVLDGDFDLFDELFFYNTTRSYNPYAEGSIRYLGVVLLQAPAFLVGHVAAHLDWLLTHDYPANGFSQPYLFFIGLSSSSAGVAGVWLTFRWVARRTGTRAALAATALFLWASPLPFYLFLWHGWTHTYSILGLALFLLQRDRVLQSDRGWYVLGMLGGLVAILWPVNGLVLLLPAVDLAARARVRGWQAVVRSGAAVAAGWLVAVAPQLGGWFGATELLYGDTYGRVGDHFRWTEPALLPMLFSPQRHGVFVWHPVMFLSFAGLFAIRDHRLRILLLVWVGLQIYTISCWSIWWSGIGFGNRFFTNLTAPAVLGLASLGSVVVNRWTPLAVRRLPAVLAVVLVILNIWLLGAYRTDVVAMGIKGPQYVQDERPSLPAFARTLLFDAPPTLETLAGAFQVNQSMLLSRWQGTGGSWANRAVLAFALFGLIVAWRWATRLGLHGRVDHRHGGRWGPATTSVALLALTLWLALGVGQARPEDRYLRVDLEDTTLTPGRVLSVVPQGYTRPTREVVLVSFLTYAFDVPVGEPAVLVRVIGERDALEFELLSGVHTAEVGAAAGVRRGRPPQVDAAAVVAHEWMTRAYSDALYPARAYRASLRLPEPKRVRRVELETFDGVGDLVVRDLFLLEDERDGA